MTNYVSLQDCCEIINGYAFKSEHYVPQGIRIIRIANVQRGYIADESPCFYSSDDPNASIRYKLFENDLLISLTGNVGRVGLLPHSLLPAALNQRVVCLRLRPESPVTKEFIFCCLNREEFENDCILNSTGVAQKNLSSKWLKAYKIPVPTPLQQQQICKSISAIDKLHNALNRKLSHFDCLVKSRFIEMFSSSAKNQPISLENLCRSIRNGANIKQDKTRSGYPITRIETISNGTFNEDKLGYGDIFDIEKYSSYILHSGDLLISHINSLKHLGRTVRFRGSSQAIIHGMNLVRVELNDLADPAYVEAALQMPEARAYIQRHAKKSVNQASISISDLKKMPVLLPPLEEQKAFANYTVMVDKLRFDDIVVLRLYLKRYRDKYMFYA